SDDIAVNPFEPLNGYFWLQSPTFDSITFRVKHYFHQIISRHKGSASIRFPSIDHLAQFLQADRQDIVSALNEVKQMGFDYNAKNTKDSIIVWDSLQTCSQH